MKIGCIQHVPKTRIVLLHEDYLAICDGDIGAAILLRVFEYWTDVKAGGLEQIAVENEARAKENYPQLTDDLWIYKTHAQLLADTLGIVKDHQIRGGLKLLLDKGYLFKRNNPKYTWDRTLQYRLNIAAVQEVLKSLNPNSMCYRQHMEASPATDGSVAGNGTIPEITTEITNINSAGGPAVSEIDYSADDPDAIFGPRARGSGQFGLKTEEERLAAASGLTAMYRNNPQLVLDRMEGWTIKQTTEAELVVAFSRATGIGYPKDTSERKLWLTGIREQLEAFEGDTVKIAELYKRAWAGYLPLIAAGQLDITHPRALTRKMRSVLWGLPRKEATKTDYNLQALEKRGIIRFSTRDDPDGSVRGAWFWSDGTEVKLPGDVDRLIAETRRLS